MAAVPIAGNVGLAFALVIAAGACTALGAALVFCSSLTNHRLLSAALGASAGVMTYVSFVEILSTKAIEAFVSAGYSLSAEAPRYATLCFFGGALLTWLLDRLVHAMMHLAKARGDKADRAARRQARKAAFADAGAAADAGGGGGGAPAEAQTLPQPRLSGASSGDVTVVVGAAAPAAPAAPCACPRRSSGGDDSAASLPALAEACRLCDGGSRCPHGPPLAIPKGENPEVRAVLEADHHAALARTGWLSGLAVMLHNLPEGLATFVAALASPKIGIAFALAVGIHNVPEGVVVAMPIYYATGSKWKGFCWSLVSGLAEPVGGLLGYALLAAGGLASPLVFGVVFAVVAGMMVYISIRELLPTALRYDPEDRYATLSFWGGAAVMAASLLLFKA
ncbi:zinc transporter [Raphidocelis subcapitata]|uniref:Zinc transporter n=1 Tax=Raphidocelis subcapitata TaxID=307507 RepID=A0A2V0NNT4_9CHLO|nr:zinc transporter [Raphidocelis subcapitata]|eukprot:GBF88162.1 zinc transporter [Raphidocelis subcapitata]